MLGLLLGLLLGAELGLVLRSKLFEGVSEGPVDGKLLIVVLVDGEDVVDVDGELFDSLIGSFE